MQSAREAKDRRNKLIAAGGAVLLAVVLAFEVPHMLKHNGGGSSTPAPASTTTPGGATTPGTTAPGTAAAAPLPTTTPKLGNSDLAPRRTNSQLYSFSHFAGKDPFVQQLSDTSATGTAAPSSNATAASTPTVASAPVRQTAARTLARTGVATIQVNGQAETVRIGGSFPSSNPLFKLVSIAHGVARIGIANGSYASGAQTVTLTSGRTLTLVDTADGVRYRLRLLTAS
jgi:hypothetical protein